MARALPNGTVLNDYRIEGVLSEAGNFSVVYLATDLDTARLERRRERVEGRRGRWRDRYGAAAANTMLDTGPLVAIKEYIPKHYGRRSANGVVGAEPGHGDVLAWGRERFSREGAFLAEHSHPNVVAIYDCFNGFGTEYYVMERLGGGSLDDVVARGGPQKEADVRRWLMPVLEGLASVERRDADHLDLSPGNIMFRTAGGDPVLVDFGASRIGGAPPLHSSRFLIDDNFAAPEKYEMSSGKLDARSDIYSLGAIVNFALTGVLPVKANERVAGATAGLPPDALRQRAGQASGNFLRVIDRAFACGPRDRFADASAMTLALGREGLVARIGHAGAEARLAPGASDPRRQMVLRIVGGAILFFIIMIIAALAVGS